MSNRLSGHGYFKSRLRSVAKRLRRGAATAFQRLLGRSEDPIVARQMMLAKQLDDLFHSTVQYGPFSGLRLSGDLWWGKTDRSSMLLGTYEQEVLQAITHLPQSRDLFINVGAADGYYAVGMVANGMCKRSICYEQSEIGQQSIVALADANAVTDRIVVRGEAGPSFLEAFTDGELSRAIVLIDVEGAEFSLLKAPQLERLRTSIVFVELHEGFFENGSRLVDRVEADASPWFKVSYLATGGRDPNSVPELCGYGDNDRWLMVSESRPYRMKWLRLDPK